MTVQKPHESAIIDLAKSLINDLLKESEKGIGDNSLDRIIKHVKFGGADATMASISALSAYAHAKAAERQANAIESLAKTASKLQIADQLDSGGQAIVDSRESKRDDLATTYSLPTDTLTLLWALRGILVDASIKSLSKPDRFDPYRRVSTEDIAWTFRVSPEGFWAMLPRNAAGSIDYALLEAFDILNFGGSLDEPDDWLYGG